MKIYIVLLFSAFFSLSCNSSDCSNEEKIYKGVYFDYPETEYERAFLICDTGELWRIGQDGEYPKLNKIYNEIEQSESGEILVEIKAEVNLIDRKKYSKSHFFANAKMSELVSYSSDISQIKECLNKSKQDNH